MECINILTVDTDNEDLEFLKLLVETVFDGVEGSTTVSWDHFKKHQNKEFDIVMTDKKGVRAFKYVEAKVLSFMIDMKKVKINADPNREMSKEDLISSITQSILRMQDTQNYNAI